MLEYISSVFEIGKKIGGNPFALKFSSILKNVKAARDEYIRPHQSKALSNAEGSTENKKWWDQYVDVFTMPFTQRVIALAFTFVPIAFAPSILSVAFTSSVVAFMHRNQTVEYIEKQKLISETKYVTDYLKSENTLVKHHEISLKLGVTLKHQGIINTQDLTPGKIKNLVFQKSFLSNFVDQLKPIGNGIASLNGMLIALTTIEVVVCAWTRLTKANKDEENKQEVKTSLLAAKKLAPELAESKKIASIALNRKVEAESLEELMNKYPGLNANNLTDAHKKEFDMMKAESYKRHVNEKGGIYSEEYIKQRKSFFRAALEVTKISPNDVSEYQTLINSKNYKALKTLLLEAQDMQKKTTVHKLDSGLNNAQAKSLTEKKHSTKRKSNRSPDANNDRAEHLSRQSINRK